ncbi:hypothetical protein [Nisaea sp.]|uniref:hypothetical protein n=1 Tax=Nisaea sp. TaxID=2024842 RepID=UPI003299035E
MNDYLDAVIVRNKIHKMLAGTGLHVVAGHDLSVWSVVVESHGGTINPQFDPVLNPQNGGYLSIHYDDTGAMACTMAWRISLTNDYIEDMRSGIAWTPDPVAIGWEPLVLQNPPEINGTVMCRGNLFSPPAAPASRGSGQKLSWFLTSLLWCVAVEKSVDHVVSHAHTDIVESGMARTLYGYARHTPMPKHKWPWFGVTAPAYMVHSSRSDFIQHVSRQARFLRLCKHHELGEAVAAYTRYQEAQEGSVQSIRTGPPEEAENGPVGAD